MPTLDFSRLSAQERLDLIGKLWDNLSPAAAPVTPAQKAEIKRRLATLDQDIANGREAAEVLTELRRRRSRLVCGERRRGDSAFCR